MNNIWHWVKKNKIIILLVVIIGIGAFFRFYKLETYLHFFKDEYDHANIIKDMVTEGKITLKGPRAIDRDGYEGYLGPAYYYIMTPPYIMTGFHPIGAAVFTVLVSLLTIWLMYKVGKDMFNERVGLFSASIYAISFLAIEYSRWPWNPNILLPFVLLSVYSLHQLIKGRQTYIWFLAFFLVVATQLHSSGFLLMPIFIVVWFIYRPKVKLTSVLGAIGLFILGYLPLIVFDVAKNFANTKAFVHTFFGKSSGGGYIEIGFWEGLVRAGKSFTKQTNLLLINSKNYFGLGILAVSLIFIISKIPIKWRNIKENPAIVILLLWVIIFVFFSSFYHFDIQNYHFMVVWPAVIFIVGLFLDYLCKIKLIGKIIVIAILGTIVYSNFIAAKEALTVRKKRLQGDFGVADQVTFGDMQALVKYIIADNRGRECQLKFYWINLPGFQFKGSYFYLFDILNNRKIPTEEDNPEIKNIYVILQPNFVFHENLTKFGQVKWEKTFGNIGLIKIERD